MSGNDLLEKMLANRDTQPELPDTDATQVVDTSVEMDVETTHEEPAPMTDGGSDDSYADDSQSQDEPEAQESESDPTEKSDWESKYDTLEKQRADNQSYYQHQINTLKAELDAKNAVVTPQEPAKPQMTDEEINDKFWDNPAEAARQMMANQTQQPNINLMVQEGVQRGLHDDYDAVIETVKRQVALNPQLEQEIMSSTDPAKAAYEKGQALKASQLITTDPVAYEAQLRAKIEAEMQSKTEMPKRVGATRGATPVHKNTSTAEEGTVFQNMFGKQRR